MKVLICMFSLLFGMTATSQNLPKSLTKSEKRFVRNVINAQKEQPVEITKRNDNFIVVEFPSTMVVLKPDGFIGEVWILGDGDWISLGTEEAAY
jgi:hypothetical protein